MPYAPMAKISIKKGLFLPYPWNLIQIQLVQVHINTSRRHEQHQLNHGMIHSYAARFRSQPARFPLPADTAWNIPARMVIWDMESMPGYVLNQWKNGQYCSQHHGHGSGAKSTIPRPCQCRKHGHGNHADAEHLSWSGCLTEGAGRRRRHRVGIGKPYMQRYIRLCPESGKQQRSCQIQGPCSPRGLPELFQTIHGKISCSCRNHEYAKQRTAPSPPMTAMADMSWQPFLLLSLLYDHHKGGKTHYLKKQNRRKQAVGQKYVPIAPQVKRKRNSISWAIAVAGKIFHGKTEWSSST